jgi:predicted O-methyltransferase YrrM
MPQRLDITRYELPELIDRLGYQTGIEIGVNLGEFSYYLLKFSRLKLLTSIDSYAGKYRQAKRGAETLLARHGDRSRLLVQGSLEAAASWDRPVDFIYIDAAHDYASVAADIRAWAPHVRPGGLLAGHDYTARHGGVIKAVDEFVAGRFSLQLTAEAWSSWLIFL